VTVEDNEELVRRMVRDGMVAGDVDAALAAYAPDLVYHAPLAAQSPPGTPPAALIGQAIAMTRTAFPDLDHRVEWVVARGDLVSLLYTWSGTHLGDLAGLAPTGRRVTATGAIFCRCAHGRIVEQWDVDDRLDLMAQLGIVPRVPG
jgi:ketosteroid isomerase-like protein